MSVRTCSETAVARLALGLACVCALSVAGCEPTRNAQGRWTFDPLAEIDGSAGSVVGARGERVPVAPPTNLVERQRIEGTVIEPDRGRDAISKPEYYLSTQAVQQQAAAAQPPIASRPPVTLNFVDADVREVVDAVLGDALQLDYVLDPRVEGTITVRTAQPLPAVAALALLENVLNRNGAVLRKDGAIYSVMPRDAIASRIAPPTLSTAQSPAPHGFGTHVIQLRHVSAETILGVVEPFVERGRTLTVERGQNALVFVGTGQEARSLLELVSIFDVNWMQNTSSALIPVEAADAETVAAEMAEIYREEDLGQAGAQIRFLPIKRMSAVLVMARDLTTLQEAQQWIKRLDRSDAGVGRRIFVYYVKNGKAADLAAVMNQVFDSTGGSRRERQAPGLAPGLDPIEIAGSEPLAAEPAVAEGDDPGPASEAGSLTEGPPPQSGIEAQRLASVGRGIALGTVRDQFPDVKIIPDETNNAIVVMATYDEFRLVEAALKRLDVLPLQVLIEATIAEVTLDDDLKYGLKWFLEGYGVEATFSSDSMGAIAPTFPGFNFIADIPNARVVLDALSTVTDVKVISSPQIMVLDNQAARLAVGDQVPIATQSAVSITDPDAPIVNSIQLVDTGVILEVTPRVNVGGLVVMEINQEVSTAVETDTSGIDSPTIQQRQVTSTIAIESGETVALGGMIQDMETRGKGKVPVLGDIPVLGHLFRSTDYSIDRTELLILITPYVVRDSRDARAITDELRRRIRSVQPLEGQVL